MVLSPFITKSKIFSLLLLFLLLISITTGFAFTASAQSSSLVAYWKFDEGTGNSVIDSSGNGNAATLQNGPTWVSGKYGSALSFDGENDFVKMPPNLVLPLDSLTISVWFKTTSYGVILGYNDAEYPSNPSFTVPILYVGIDGKLRGSFWVNSWYNNWPNSLQITTPSEVNDGNWHFAVITANSASSQSLYLDGTLIGTLSGSLDQGTNHQGNMIYNYIGSSYLSTSWPGSTGTTTWSFFKGTIDEVQIYDRVLSQNEIQSLINPPVSSSTPQPTQTSSPASTIHPTSGEDGRYYNDKHGFSLQPPKGWLTDENFGSTSSGTEVTVLFSLTQSTRCSIGISVTDYEGITLSEVVASIKKEVPPHSNYQRLSETYRTVAGVNCWETVETYTSGGLDYKGKGLALVNKDKIFLVIFMDDPASYDTHVALFENSIQTLEFYEPIENSNPLWYTIGMLSGEIGLLYMVWRFTPIKSNGIAKSIKYVIFGTILIVIGCYLQDYFPLVGFARAPSALPVFLGIGLFIIGVLRPRHEA